MSPRKAGFEVAKLASAAEPDNLRAELTGREGKIACDWLRSYAQDREGAVVKDFVVSEPMPRVRKHSIIASILAAAFGLLLSLTLVLFLTPSAG